MEVSVRVHCAVRTYKHCRIGKVVKFLATAGSTSYYVISVTFIERRFEILFKLYGGKKYCEEKKIVSKCKKYSTRNNEMSRTPEIFNIHEEKFTSMRGSKTRPRNCFRGYGRSQVEITLKVHQFGATRELTSAVSWSAQ